MNTGLAREVGVASASQVEGGLAARRHLSGAWMILLSRLWCREVAADRPRNSTVSEVTRHSVMPAAQRAMKTCRQNQS